MAGSVNKVILVGNLGKDPEVRTFQNGNKSVSFSVATSESWKDKASGERKEKTQWHNVVIFNDALGDIASRYLKKGSKVYLEGQIESRKYTDQSGQEKFITEVVLNRFRGELTLLDGRSGDSAPAHSGGYDAGASQGGSPDYAPAASGARSPAPASDFDDEVPF